MLALAEQCALAGRAEESEQLLAEADETAQSAGAVGVVRWVAATRKELGVLTTDVGNADVLDMRKTSE